MPRPSNPVKLLASTVRLPDEALEQLIRKLTEELSDRADRRKQSENSSWQEEYRKCGKSNCWCVHEPVGKGHDPYYYRSVWKDGKPTKEYKSKRKKPA